MQTNNVAIKQEDQIQLESLDTITYGERLSYAHQQGIQSLETKIIQFPNAENKHTAICSATLVTQNGSIFTDVADASAEGIPLGCVESPVCIAADKAKSRVIADGFNLQSKLKQNALALGSSQNVIDVTEYKFKDPANDKAKANGGGSKPATDKQKTFLINLCIAKAQDPEAMAQQMFGKSVNELQGQEANKIIQALQ